MNVHCLLLWKPVVDAGCFHDSLRWQTCSDRQSQTYRSAPWSISTRLTSVMYFCHDGVFGGFVMQQCSHGHSSVHELAQGMLNNEPIVVVSSDGSEQVWGKVQHQSSVFLMHLKINNFVSKRLFIILVQPMTPPQPAYPNRAEKDHLSSLEQDCDDRNTY